MRVQKHISIGKQQRRLDLLLLLIALGCAGGVYLYFKDATFACITFLLAFVFNWLLDARAMVARRRVVDPNADAEQGHAGSKEWVSIALGAAVFLMTVLGLPWLGVYSYVDGLLIGLSIFFIDWAIPYGVQLFRCLGITVG